MIEFRLMAEEDLEEVSLIYEICFPEMCKNKRRKVSYRDGVLLAMVDSKIVGMATIDYLDDNFLGEKIAYISNFCIIPEYRGRGIGYRLMKECERRAKEMGATMMELTSNKTRIFAHKLYKKCGFYTYDTVVFKKNIS